MLMSRNFEDGCSIASFREKCDLFGSKRQIEPDLLLISYHFVLVLNEFHDLWTERPECVGYSYGLSPPPLFRLPPPPPPPFPLCSFVAILFFPLLLDH